MEHLPSVERQPEPEHHESTAEKAVQNERLRPSHEELAREQEHRANRARSQVEHLAHSKKEIQHSGAEDTQPQPVRHITAELKDLAYGRLITRIRKRLNPAEKTLDRVVQQPTVAAASDVGAATIARPWGLFGGGLAALVGYGIALYYAKHYGFALHPILLVVLFAGGYFAALLTELLVRIIRISRPRND